MIRDMEDEIYEMKDATNIVKLRAVGSWCTYHSMEPSSLPAVDGRSLQLLEWVIL